MASEVYMHFFPDGKVYVGTCADGCESVRWAEGKGYRTKKMREAIARFGWENVKHRVVCEGLTDQLALDIETLLIIKYNAVENGYNTTYGKGLYCGYGKGFADGRISAFEEARKETAV